MSENRIVPKDRLATLILNIATLITNQIAMALDVLGIKAKTDALPTVVNQGGVIASAAAEVDVYVNNAPAGIIKPLIVQIDFTNQQAGDTIRIREYYRIVPGGNLIMEDFNDIPGVQARPLIRIELGYNRYGVRVTMERTAGAQRNYPHGTFWKE